MIRGKSMKEMECFPVIICFPPVQCTWYPFVPGATDTLVEVSPHLSTMLHTSSAGPALAQKLLYLCLKHYSLASTTVTGIPMKEEQVRTVTNSQYSYVLTSSLTPKPSKNKLSRNP